MTTVISVENLFRIYCIGQIGMCLFKSDLKFLSTNMLSARIIIDFIGYLKKAKG